MKYGYFDDENREYVITNPKTPYPWINYLGNEDFFSLTSNTGGGYTFYKDGKIAFSSGFYNKAEFLAEPAIFNYVDVHFSHQKIALEKDSICFTYCQVSVIYKMAANNGVEVLFNNKSSKSFKTLELDRETSNQVFERSEEVVQIIDSLRK